MLLVAMLQGEATIPESPTWQADAQNGHMSLLLMTHWSELVTWLQTQKTWKYHLILCGACGKIKHLVNSAHDHTEWK